ncbi:DnaJ family domain-containing protein [Rhodococcus chondri]|uniref:DUF1992 domain-containing protein n=1 Tax=Rhodococcus chondri TaxID=3065941 RepID=A0ABU7JL38_9NOCA|nr:DUF1992 domain-containing protein [Rhodococcus sp. CC-R104]MEE2030520.1 DUF1992 domain-containing protein [Rhodococcus sp. CC-R104]
MTERKRPDITFESWIERQIRVAQERGDLDNLPGSGKPIPNHGNDELWWVKSYLAREGLSTEALLPPELQLRREIERLPDTLGTVTSERAVREIVADLNRRVAECLRLPGRLPVPVHKMDADAVVETWKASREKRRDDARRALRASQQTAAGRTVESVRPARKRPLFRWFRAG